MSGKRHDAHRRRRSVNKYRLLMATLNLPHRWSVSHVSSRAKGNERFVRNVWREEGCRGAGRRSFLLVCTSNILIGQWLYTRRNVIRETMYFSRCRNNSSLKSLRWADNVGSHQQQLCWKHGRIAVARPCGSHTGTPNPGEISDANRRREIAQKWY